MRRIRILLVVLVLSFIGLGWTAAAHAEDNFRTGNDVTVAKEESLDTSLFASGRTIDIAGTVDGDVFCAGQSITITGHVTGDVICAGQTITISGNVDGSVRVAGQTVAVGGTVGHNLTAAGQTVTLDASSTVKSDAEIGAQTATLNGTIGRDLAAGATSMTVNGTVNRNVQASVSDVTLGSSSLIRGDLTYVSAHDAHRETGAQVSGKVSRQQPPASQENGPRIGAIISGSFLSVLYLAIALLLVSLALILIFPQAIHDATEVAVRSPWKTLLVGFLASFIGPIVLLVLTFTVVGIPLAVLGGLAWILIVCLAVPFAAYYLGSLLLSKSTNNPVWIMLLGTAIIVVLYLIPIVGFVAWLVATWFGLGIILLQARHLPRPRYDIARG